MNKKQQTISAYNKGAKLLAAEFNTLGPRQEDIKRAFSYIKKENAKVLEIGCGNGRDAKEIIKYTYNYLGIDASTEMVKIARKNVPGGKFKIADIETCKFPCNIDIIFAFASLLHSNKIAVNNILKKSYKTLNKSGIFYISLKYGAYQKVTKIEKFGKRTYYFYLPRDIKKLVKNKFKVLYEDIQKLRGQKWFTIILKR